MNIIAIVVIALFVLAVVAAFMLFRQRGQVEIKDLRDKRETDEGGATFSRRVGPPSNAEGEEPRVMQWGGGKLDASVLRTESDVEHPGVDAPMEWVDWPLGDAPHSAPGGEPGPVMYWGEGPADDDAPDADHPASGPIFSRPAERPMDVGPSGPEMGGPDAGMHRVMRWGEGPIEGGPPDADHPAGGPIFSRPAERPMDADPGASPDVKDVEAQGNTPSSGTRPKQEPDSKADTSK